MGGLVQEVTELGEASGEVHVDWSEVSPVASLGQPGGAGGTRPPSRSRFFSLSPALISNTIRSVIFVFSGFSRFNENSCFPRKEKAPIRPL